MQLNLPPYNFACADPKAEWEIPTIESTILFPPSHLIASLCQNFVLFLCVPGSSLVPLSRRFSSLEHGEMTCTHAKGFVLVGLGSLNLVKRGYLVVIKSIK